MNTIIFSNDIKELVHLNSFYVFLHHEKRGFHWCIVLQPSYLRLLSPVCFQMKCNLISLIKMLQNLIESRVNPALSGHQHPLCRTWKLLTSQVYYHRHRIIYWLHKAEQNIKMSLIHSNKTSSLSLCSLARFSS